MMIFLFLLARMYDSTVSVGLGLQGLFVKSLTRSGQRFRSERQEVKERGERSSGQLEFCQAMLICRYIKKWEDLFRNIDFHTAGMKNDIGHNLQCVSIQLWTVTI